jgi:Protein of unknown function (DUF3667)
MRPESQPLAAPAESAAAPCLNCATPVTQRFCPACGQEKGHALQRPFRQIVGEVLDETIALDSRLVHTVVPLLFRPGFLTVEHLAGRKARSTSPLKLYLLFSFIFFVAAALTPGDLVRISPPEESRAALEATRGATDAGIAELRAKGWLGARVADRVTALRILPRAEVQARVNAAIQEYAPRVLFFLVPVLALLLKLAWHRRYYAEHLVTAFHAHAVGFAALLPGELSGQQVVTQVGSLAAGLWLLLALRRIHGQGWPRTLAKGLPVLLAYAMALGLGLVGALSAGMLLL